MRRAWRLIVGIVGVAGVYLAAWGAVIVFLLGAIAVAQPDATAPDGDPCCPTPDSWGDVALGVAGALFVAALDVALFAVSVAVVWWALRQRWPTRRKLAVATALTAVVAVPAWYASVLL